MTRHESLGEDSEDSEGSEGSEDSEDSEDSEEQYMDIDNNTVCHMTDKVSLLHNGIWCRVRLFNLASYFLFI